MHHGVRTCIRTLLPLANPTHTSASMASFPSLSQLHRGTSYCLCMFAYYGSMTSDSVSYTLLHSERAAQYVVVCQVTNQFHPGSCVLPVGPGLDIRRMRDARKKCHRNILIRSPQSTIHNKNENLPRNPVRSIRVMSYLVTCP